MTQPAKNIQGRERPQLSTVLWLSGNETDYAHVARLGAARCNILISGEIYPSKRVMRLTRTCSGRCA